MAVKPDTTRCPLIMHAKISRLIYPPRSLSKFPPTDPTPGRPRHPIRFREILAMVDGGQTVKRFREP